MKETVIFINMEESRISTNQKVKVFFVKEKVSFAWEYGFLNKELQKNIDVNRKRKFLLEKIKKEFFKGIGKDVKEWNQYKKL